MTSLGYWSLPFTLEEHPLDNHWMITYSVPLLCNGEIYGIVGAEVSTSYLSNNYLSLRELDRSQNAGYALAIDQGDGNYRAIIGKGALYEAVHQEDGLYPVENIGQQSAPCQGLSGGRPGRLRRCLRHEAL